MQNFWDLSYSDGDHVQHWEDPATARTIDQWLADGAFGMGRRAVDLGCGGGLEALRLAEHGFAVVAVDSSMVALDIAGRRTTNDRVRSSSGGAVIWCQASVLSVPLAAKSIDLVHDRGCLHCFDEPLTRQRYATEIDRILRPGGRVVITGAHDSDDTRGVTAVDHNAIAHLFPRHRWIHQRLEVTRLVAPAGSLPALRAILERRR